MTLMPPVHTCARASSSLWSRKTSRGGKAAGGAQIPKPDGNLYGLTERIS